MHERDCGSSGPEYGRAFPRRTVLGASLAGLAGVGLAGTAASQDEELPNELEIVSQTNRVEYTFEVDGRVEFGDTAGDGDEIENGTTVTGVINGAGRDDYLFSGDITTFEITEGSDAARVFVNGEEVDDPEDLESGDPDRGSIQEIALQAQTDEVDYVLAVAGDLERVPGEGGGEIDDGFSVAGTIEGDEEHVYRARGDLLVLEVSTGIATFAVDIEDVDSTDQDRLPHHLEVYGLGDAVRYRFAASEAVEFGDASEDEATDVPADEQIDERTVEGHVHAHDDGPQADDYRFSGALSFERAESPVRVWLRPNHEPDE
jgi:hypothetical protein